MLNEEDYSSDTSDEDFVPEGATIESEDDDDEGLSEKEGEENIDDDASSKNKKRKRKVGKQKKKKKMNPLLASTTVEESNPELTKGKDKTEEDTKNADSLWADFLADVDEKPSEKPKAKSKNSWASLLDSNKMKTSCDNSTSKESTPETTKTNNSVSEPAKVKITKVFEFAGEEVRVEEEVAADSAEAKKAAMVSEAKDNLDTKKLIGRKKPAGLSSIMSLLDSKKNKLSTLDKTKLDWKSFKASEGVEEELQQHLKSKDGYLEKKDFLERADLRQFEIERNMRMSSRRSNR